jgi:hypothetical protein
VTLENGSAAFGSAHTVTLNPSNGTAGTPTGYTSVTSTPFGSGYVYTLITAAAGGTLIANFEWRFTNNGDSMLYGRPQFEAGAFATSYIPTVASQVTRTADQCSIVAPLFAPWYNQSEGTIVASILSAPVNTIAQQALYLSDGTSSNIIFTRRAVGGSVATAVTTGGVVQGDVSAGSAVAGSAAYKYAFAYAANDLAESVNGSAVGTDTSATIPTLSQMNLGASVANIQLLNGHIRQIAYYNTRLPNATLVSLTA